MAMIKTIKIEGALNNFKKYLMPANFTDINAMIKKIVMISTMIWSNSRLSRSICLD